MRTLEIFFMLFTFSFCFVQILLSVMKLIIEYRDRVCLQTEVRKLHDLLNDSYRHNAELEDKIGSMARNGAVRRIK